jgi:NodT family efflux transporter outer membrane factor (OMF) lipoprotein
MRKPGLLLAAGIVAASGCARQPAVIPPAIPPAPRFAAAADSVVSTDPPIETVWAQLGDSTLNRLIEEALQSNPDVRVAAARLRAARANRRLSMFDYAPTITASGSYSRSRLSRAQAPGVPDAFREGDLWDAGFDASWELDVFGRVRKTVAAQAAFEASAREDVRFAQVSLTAELARTYFELRGAQSELAVAQQNAENQRRTLKLTEDRLEGGKGTSLDRERANAQLNTTLAAIPTLEAEASDAIFRIGVLVGRPPATLEHELAVARDLPTLPARPAVGTPEMLLRQRPDVRSAERQLAAERALVGAARTEYLPRVDVVGGIGLTSTTLDSLGKPGTSRYVVGPVVSWPLLDLGRVKTRVEATRARADEARAQYDAVVLRALQETESALVTFDRSRARLGLLRQASEASERGAELARLRYESGIADFLQVLDAERTLLEAQDQLARGRTDAATAFVALYKALGGAWPVEGSQ